MIDKSPSTFLHSFCGIMHFLETFFNPKNVSTSIHNAIAVRGNYCDTC